MSLQNYNNINTCCCTYGMKYAICILQDLIDTQTLIENYQFYYSCGISSEDDKLVKNKYPNFVLLQQEIVESQSPNKIKSTNICIEDLDYIKIVPKANESASIVNELNKYYISPSVLEVRCNESCCCKNSALAFMKDKYMNMEWGNRQFRVGLRDEDYIIPEDENNFVTVIHMDYDIAWLKDEETQIFYLVSLCKICALIDIK